MFDACTELSSVAVRSVAVVYEGTMPRCDRAVGKAEEGEGMTKAAFNALITEFSVEDRFPGEISKQKEGHVGLAIISDPAGDLWHLFIDNKPVKVQIVDKESSFDFTEREVERRRRFNIRLVEGSFQCSVSVNYHINGKYHHDRNTLYSDISNCTIQRLYGVDRVCNVFESSFGFSLHSNTERTDLLPMRKQFDKEKVYDQLERIVHHRFMAGQCRAYKNNKAYIDHRDAADEAFTELLVLLGMEDIYGVKS